MIDSKFNASEISTLNMGDKVASVNRNGLY
jgi:hypothetical protein